MHGEGRRGFTGGGGGRRFCRGKEEGVLQGERKKGFCRGEGKKGFAGGKENFFLQGCRKKGGGGEQVLPFIPGNACCHWLPTLPACPPCLMGQITDILGK